MPEIEATELTHEEQIELAMRVMAEQPAKDLEVGQKWLRSQRRVIVIREVDHDH